MHYICGRYVWEQAAQRAGDPSLQVLKSRSNMNESLSPLPRIINNTAPHMTIYTDTLYETTYPPT